MYCAGSDKIYWFRFAFILTQLGSCSFLSGTEDLVQVLTKLFNLWFSIIITWTSNACSHFQSSTDLPWPSDHLTHQTVFSLIWCLSVRTCFLLYFLKCLRQSLILHCHLIKCNDLIWAGGFNVTPSTCSCSLPTPLILFSSWKIFFFCSSHVRWLLSIIFGFCTVSNKMTCSATIKTRLIRWDGYSFAIIFLIKILKIVTILPHGVIV